MVNTDMLDPDAQTNVDRKQIEEMQPSKLSMMPEGLLDTLERDEVARPDGLPALPRRPQPSGLRESKVAGTRRLPLPQSH